MSDKANTKITTTWTAKIIGAILLVSSSFATAQYNWDVENLGSPINTEAREAFPTVSEDGLSLYFARFDIAKEVQVRATWDIWVSEREALDSPWKEPQRLPDHINTSGGSEHSVSFSPDGHWLYFSSTALGTHGGWDIFRSYRQDVSDPLAWGEPENLGLEVNTPATEVCVIYHLDEATGQTFLYFVSNREGSIGSLDAWRMRYDPATDRFFQAEPVEAVNTPSFDGHLDPIAGYVWSSREGGFGQDDIWYSPRDEYGNWLTPVNAGAGLNTEYSEQLPSPTSHDGNVIFFPSDRPGGEGGMDIYIGTRIE